MLWNPHPFKEEIQQVSGLETGERKRQYLGLREFNCLYCCELFCFFTFLFVLMRAASEVPEKTKPNYKSKTSAATCKTNTPLSMY